MSAPRRPRGSACAREGRADTVAAQDCVHPRKGPRFRWCLVTVAPILLSVGGCAGSGGSRVPRDAVQLGSRLRREGRPVNLQALGGFLGAGYLFMRDEQTNSGDSTTEHLVQERLGLGIDGNVMTPEFLRFQAAGVFGLSQQWAESTSIPLSTFDLGELYEADATVLLFPRRWYPSSLYFNRTEDFQPRIFFSRYEITTTSAGGNQEFRFDKGLVRFGAVHREIEQTVFGQGGASSPLVDSTEDSVEASGRSELTSRQSVDGRYVYRDVRRVPEESSFSEHRFDADHIWRLGATEDHELRSSLQGELRDGLLEQELLRLDETFRSRITDTLTGHTGLHLEGGTRNGMDVHEIHGDAELGHQLFRSLATSLRLQGGRFATGDSNIDAVGGGVSFNYRKETPVGVLRINYSNDIERRYIESGNGTVIDEPHTFPSAPPDEVRLISAGIDLATIFVTDPTGIIIYREGIDYTAIQDAGGITTLTWEFTGNIPPGGDILVDYVYRVGADFTQNNMIQRSRVEHSFYGGVTPYFEFRRQDQHLRDVSGVGTPIPTRERALIGGFEWSWSAYRLGAEYEDRESTINPLEAVRLMARGAQRIGDHHEISAGASQTWIFEKDEDRDLSIAQGQVGWRSSVGRDLSLRLDAAFRYQDDTLSGTSTAFSARSELEYIWRRFSVRLRAAYRDTRTDVSGFGGVEVSLWIVREFGTPTSSLRRSIDRMARQ